MLVRVTVMGTVLARGGLPLSVAVRSIVTRDIVSLSNKLGEATVISPEEQGIN